MSNLKTQTPGDIVQLEALRRDYADLGKSRQSVEPPEITACGIRLLSRDGCGVEMIEMLSFARRLAALGLHPFVGSVFYDSNSCLAVLEIDSKVTPGSTVAGSIYSIAEDTLSQFEWLDGTVRSATD